MGGSGFVGGELLRLLAGHPDFDLVVAGARLVAAAGCYVTAAALALAPLVKAGAIEADGVIVDAASGVSGAGRAARDSTHFNTVDEDFTAYGLLDHRHTPEIEQATGASVLFTPHLAPMNRGILATCYGRAVGAVGALGASDPLALHPAPDPAHLFHRQRVHLFGIKHPRRVQPRFHAFRDAGKVG